MPSALVLDFDTLLAPIPGERPAGESLRYSGAYDAIQEARRSDDALAQGEWKRDTKTADWDRVIEIATEALAKKTKDVQIAAWLVEALVKRHGFAGVRDGVRLLAELQDRFWDSLYPMTEGGDLEFRVAPMEWLNEKLPLSIREVPLVPAEGGRGFSWVQWEESRAVDNLARQNPEAHAAALAEGKITGERFDKAVAASPRAHWETLLEDMTAAREALARLDRIAGDRFGREAPSLLAIRKAMEDCLGLVEGIARKKRALEPEPPSSSSDAQAIAGGGGAEGLDGSPPPPEIVQAFGTLAPQNRADALRRLAAVAEFFRRTEPHSPVSYLVQRAVGWGKMPLEDWLAEVIANEEVLVRVRETLGLKASRPSEGAE